MSESSRDIKRCSWPTSKNDNVVQSSSNLPPDSSNNLSFSNAPLDSLQRVNQNRTPLHYFHQPQQQQQQQHHHNHHLHQNQNQNQNQNQATALTLNESSYPFDLPDSFFSSRITGSRTYSSTAPMSSLHDSASLPINQNNCGTNPDSIRAEPAPLFSVDINRSSHLPSLLFPTHPISAPSPVSPNVYAINHSDNNSLFQSSPFPATQQQQQQQLPKSNPNIFQSPRSNHNMNTTRPNQLPHQSTSQPLQLSFGNRDEPSTTNTTQPISGIPFDRSPIALRKRLSSSPDDVAQVGFSYGPITNTPTLNLPRLVHHPISNIHRMNTIGASFNTSSPLALLPKSNTASAGPSRARIGAVADSIALGAGSSNQNRMAHPSQSAPIMMDEDLTQDTIGVRYKTPVEELPHIRIGIEHGEANLSRSSALKTYLHETEKRIQKTPGLAGEMWGGPKRSKISVSVRYPRGDDDVDVLLDEATVLHSAWFARLREGLTIQLEEIKQCAIQTEELMERRLDRQRQFRSIPIEEVNKRMEYCRAKFLKCRLAVLEKYKTFVRALKWVHLSPKRVRRGSLTQVQNNVLRLWLFRHFTDPYPTAAEKQRLMQECQMDDTQIGNWFINSRVRIWKPCLNAVSQSQAATETVHQLEEKRRERALDRQSMKRRRVGGNEEVVGSGSSRTRNGNSAGRKLEGSEVGRGSSSAAGKRPW